ncbi:hypothetical protein C1H46_034216 [Malus baccata]|uniref:Uncharacterized protein n=1 Tax=Malus baccata TaxID=106549 RepID=A0A540L1B5_MALBA|nr:hypothetical protein C1H46_034216 [Malus baccata]
MDPTVADAGASSPKRWGGLKNLPQEKNQGGKIAIAVVWILGEKNLLGFWDTLASGGSGVIVSFRHVLPRIESDQISIEGKKKGMDGGVEPWRGCRG